MRWKVRKKERKKERKTDRQTPEANEKMKNESQHVEMYSRAFRHCKVQEPSKWERLHVHVPSFISDYYNSVSEYT